MQVAAIVNNFFEIYFWIILVRIFLTWIPNVDWSAPFFKALSIVTDIVLVPFRRIIPPISGIDFSPIIALLVLQFIQTALIKTLLMLGL